MNFKIKMEIPKFLESVFHLQLDAEFGDVQVDKRANRRGENLKSDEVEHYFHKSGL